MAKIRSFIAVQVSERVNNNIARVVDRLAATQADFKWVKPESLHVTLNFVGDLVDIEVPEFCKLIKQAVADVPSFDLSLNGVGGFPDSEQPRTLWIGVDQGADELKSLYKKLEAVLSHWGINKDRNEYVPHMTLGRIQRGGSLNEKLLDLIHRLRNHDGGFCTVDKVIVFSSFVDRGGPSHSPMATIRLK